MNWSPPIRAPPRQCEIDRAFRELIGRPWLPAPGAGSDCSPDPPESRDYPLSPHNGAKFALCNGHLRDLFEALGHLPRAPATPPAA